MSHMNTIGFPTNVNVVRTRVSSSDVYGKHILAEEIIETDLSEKDIRKIIAESPNGEKIAVFALTMI